MWKAPSSPFHKVTGTRRMVQIKILGLFSQGSTLSVSIGFSFQFKVSLTGKSSIPCPQNHPNNLFEQNLQGLDHPATKVPDKPSDSQ